eukprot:CAMPEP_0184518478 /NCGR_PEP_ID=MMETSP0198_2-20121128/6108_1 /TAXON_ID=1112570 /ORGANISM="Thraustochytrium sp., Strain LLF1b" /LENGTH=236 /DNA_ID=CAMNT_0026908917 /DNA_START=130 /DNA_END=837 /DNA_ORIENTATION=+
MKSKAGASKAASSSHGEQAVDLFALERPESWGTEQLEAARKEFKRDPGCHALDALMRATEIASAKIGKPLARVLCLGLGRLATKNAQLQVAAMLALMEAVKEGVFSKTVVLEAFDPVFDLGDKIALRQAGFVVFDDEETAKKSHKADIPTLFFMPHCHWSLYEQIVQANWSKACLDQMIILGNSLQAYENVKDSDLMHARKLMPFLIENDSIAPALVRDSAIERALNQTTLQYAEP